LCSLIMHLGSDFVVFGPTISKCLIRHPITHPGYDRVVAALLSGKRLAYEGNDFSNIFLEQSTDNAEHLSNINDNKLPEDAPLEAANLMVNQIHLKQAWDTAQINTRQDWLDWIHGLGVEFIRQSPSHALRACTLILHSPVAKEIFNAAFLSCWTELSEQYQDHLVRSIEIALTSPSTPSEVIRRLLDLCEFMEHEAKPMPIDHSTLGEYATKSFAYAKALHYRELEFFSNASSSTASASTLKSLFSINTRLEHEDAAWGACL
ncbi:armadillo-type protein, partial [Favolaschia claudopus]